MKERLKNLIKDETYTDLWQRIVKKTKGYRILVALLVLLVIIPSIARLATAIINTPAWPKWTGLGENTAWDLADLLLVPIVLAIGGYFLSKIQRKQDREIAKQERDTDREIAAAMEQERTLQSYIDAMKELLLDKNLLQSEEDDPVRDIAKTLTLAVIHRLDGKHNEIALRFLTAAKIIRSRNLEDARDKEPDTAPAIINFRDANLTGVNFNGMACVGLDLSEANLSEADLNKADLNKADLTGANLSKANLSGANLSGANLGEANLGEADLSKAILEGANLNRVNLGGAILGEANLTKANLSGTILIRADLRRTNLMGADLRRAILYGANLGEAYLVEAYLGEVYLGDANLEGAWYDKKTEWPERFDHEAAGAVLVES